MIETRLDVRPPFVALLLSLFELEIVDGAEQKMILETLQPSIAVGDRVILNHLQTRSDLNGQQGIVMKQKNETYQNIPFSQSRRE